MTGVLLRVEGHRDIGTHGEEGRDDAGRGWRFAARSQGTPRVAGSHRTLGERPGTDSPPESPEGSRFQTSDL